jgi:hypothetical protein
MRRFPHRLQHEEQPRLPGFVASHVDQQSVIIILVLNDVSTQVKYGQG